MRTWKWVWPMLGVILAMARPGVAAAQPPDSTDVDAETSSSSEAAGRLESLTEQLQTLQADTDKLKKFKFSGYLQARWEHSEDQQDTVGLSGTPLTARTSNVERFYIRRGRLKLTYDSSPLSQAVIYIDGNTAGSNRNVTLLEAYVTLLDPWTTDHRHGLTIGQFNVPFGYEIERSSSLRELPERSRAENVLFNGERDRGIKLVNAWSPKFETVVAVLNGGGINNATYPTADPTKAKDWTARARVSVGTVEAAASGYWGKETIPLTNDDAEVDRTRFGGDAQVYYELPALGGGSLKGEYYVGTNANADSVRLLVTTTPPIVLVPNASAADLATDVQGGYAMLVQNLGERFQFAARFDWFDPNTDLEHDQFERVGLGLHYFYDGFTRITAAYDIPMTDKASGGGYTDPKDNLWTVQFQHRF